MIKLDDRDNMYIHSTYYSMKQQEIVMARGGISKVDVLKARELVLAKGENPSIDAVRVALGNTGSKSTIHRYLKEIEDDVKTKLDDEAYLTDAIKDLISRLAAQLSEDAQEQVEKAEYKHRLQKEQWEKENANLQKNNEELKGLLAESQSRMIIESEEKVRLTEQLNATTGFNQKLQQQVESFEILINEKQQYIHSLEEKHQHARDTLAHYRESVKTQRDQEAIRHDQQLQRLQSELRELNQVISLKQSEVTQLNKDNAQLSVEITQFQRIASELESSNKSLQKELADFKSLARKHKEECKALLETKESLISANEKLSLSVSELEQQSSAQATQVIALKAEVETVNRLFERLKEDAFNAKTSKDSVENPKVAPNIGEKLDDHFKDTEDLK